MMILKVLRLSEKVFIFTPTIVIRPLEFNL